MVGIKLKRFKGFTLVELMVVVAIISILAAIAFPSYQSYALESRRSEGTGELTKIMGLQERFYINQFPPTYQTDLTLLGYTSNPVITENGYYSVAADACGTAAADIITSCVRLTATARNEQAGDGNLTLDSRGNKSRVGGTGSGWD